MSRWRYLRERLEAYLDDPALAERMVADQWSTKVKVFAGDLAYAVASYGTAEHEIAQHYPPVRRAALGAVEALQALIQELKPVGRVIRVGGRAETTPVSRRLTGKVA